MWLVYVGKSPLIQTGGAVNNDIIKDVEKVVGDERLELPTSSV